VFRLDDRNFKEESERNVIKTCNFMFATRFR